MDKANLTSFKRNRRGVTGIEYGVLLALIAGLVIVPVAAMGTSVQQIFCQMGGVLGGAACPDASASAGTPGAGEVPFPNIPALPAGTVCKTQPDGYPASGGVAGFVRACTEPNGALYSAAYIAYDSATGAVNTTVFQGSTSDLILAQNGSGETLEVPTPSGPVSVLNSGSFFTNIYYTQYFNAEIFNNAAYATTFGTTIPDEITQENNSYGGVATSLGSENTAMNYISGLNIAGSPVPTQSGSGNAVFLYSAGY
jgi:Flp pilus assembly pilin Flp